MSNLTRRDLLKGATAAGGALLLPALPAYASRRREALLTSGGFAHGVAAGQPSRNAITLWTRVEDLHRSGLVDLEVARDPGFSRVVHHARVRATALRDGTVHTRVSGLATGEHYWYRFAHKGAESAVGRFTTARPADSSEPIRIGFFSCQNWGAGYYSAHRGLAAEEDLDAVVCLGDYIYESNATSSLAGRDDKSSKSSSGQTETLADYRAKYALYRSDPALQAMHAAHPFVAIWDDHEVENNYAGTTPGTTSRRTIPFLDRRRNGYSAFFEWLPLEHVGKDPTRIYRSLPLGANAELFLIDTRQYRDDQPCGDEAGILGQDCDDATRFDPKRTLLGAAQKRWLVDRLTASPAAWKVVANQMMIMGTDGLPGMSTGTDNWDGYAGERREVLGALRDRHVKDVTFLTGDVHTFYAGVATTTGRISGDHVATEFVGGSITSGAPADDTARLTAEVENLYNVSNPQWSFADYTNKGYGVVEANAEDLNVWFRAPVSVRTRDSPVRTLAQFRVPRGTTVVQRVQ